MALLVGLRCLDKFYFSTLNQMIKIAHIFSNHQKAGMQKCFVSGAGLVAQDVVVGQDAGDVAHRFSAPVATVLPTAEVGAFAVQWQGLLDR